MFIKDYFSKEYIKGYFNRNKILIIISITIFVLSVILGAVFHETFKQLATEIIKQMLEEIPLESVSQNAINLFVNNIIANFLIIAGGLLFSLISIFSIIINGILIGYVYTLTSPTVFLVGTIPHGIFELSALILSFTGAFIITKTELIIIQALYRRKFDDEKERILINVKDVLFTLISTFILLIIAAIIEAGVTPVLLNILV